MGFRLRPKAKGDIRDIVSYIAGHNPRTALEWQDEILKTIEILTDFPEIGNVRRTRRLSFGFFTKDNYLIVYITKPPGKEMSGSCMPCVTGRKWYEDIEPSVERS